MSSVTAKQPAASAAKPGRGTAQVVLRFVVVALIGALVGVGAGFMVNTNRQESYVATSTFALIPGVSLPSTKGSSAQLPPVDPGQLTLLTPVIAAITSDASTSDVVKKQIGSDDDWATTEALVPNSPLLFTVRTTAESAQKAKDVATTYEKVMTKSPKVSGSLSGSGAVLRVVTAATLPAKSATPSSLLIIAATGVGGAFVAAAIYWLVLNRRKFGVNQG